ncbi:MAG: trypsin-like peptidase domain-containing protein [Planctomycetes bacterium]|nr:trypsin-like peptidase domain-containing protein [Planctomycetota bacterium]
MLVTTLTLSLAFASQDPQAPVLAAERERIALVARCAPAVCSVMGMDEPGGGSGVVFDPRGYVLTNYHVVGEPDKGWKPPEAPAGSDAERAAWAIEHHPRGARQYRNKKVGLPDGELYEAVVLGIDPGSDLAVLRLLPKHPGQTWPHRPLGDSDRLLVGETVFAMGNPFLLATDFTPTVTFGIVSGTHRYQEGQGQRMLVYPDCIQVDAPINPGNSGGPLFDGNGDVVGINGRIAIGARGRVNVGVGFAIASNQIRNFLGDLMAGRHAEHGTLDLSAWFMSSATEGTRRRGVYVQSLFRDSIAAAAGIGLGDELLRFDGTEIRSANQLATLVGVLPAGAWVTVWHRQLLQEGAFGDERRVTLRLSRLDTGSSLDAPGEERLASRAERRLVAAALLANWPPPATAETAEAVHWRRVAPDGTEVRAIQAGDRLRLELGDRVLVRESAERGFALQAGTVRELSADEMERLRREWTANSVLMTRPRATAALADALLAGGAHVHGLPAARFELPGDGDCEAWFTFDGRPAGFAFRDPLRRARVEWHVRGTQLRVVVDGALETGWSADEVKTGPVDESWFRRQP